MPCPGEVVFCFPLWSCLPCGVLYMFRRSTLFIIRPVKFGVRAHGERVTFQRRAGPCVMTSPAFQSMGMVIGRGETSRGANRKVVAS